MILEGFAAVQRNLGALFTYIGIIGGLQIARILTDTFAIGPQKDELLQAYLNAYEFSADLLQALAYALAQCIAFARLGREIDQPLWKVDTARESIRRFFKLWFLLMLMLIVLGRLTERMDQLDSEALARFFSFCSFIVVLVAVPFGSAVMFYGRVGRAEFAKVLDTFSRQFPRLLLVLLVVLSFQYIIMLLHGAELPKRFLPILSLVDGYGDCLIFSCTWLLCMYHRDEDDSESDFDF